MPGPLYHVGGVATCPHVTGQIAFAPTNSRVMVMGAPVAVATDQFMITGCPFTLPGTPPVYHPCVIATLAPSARVKVMGAPAIVTLGPSVCRAADQAPQGPAVHSANQTRVVAQ